MPRPLDVLDNEAGHELILSHAHVRNAVREDRLAEMAPHDQALDQIDIAARLLNGCVIDDVVAVHELLPTIAPARRGRDAGRLVGKAMLSLQSLSFNAKIAPGGKSSLLMLKSPKSRPRLRAPPQ